MASLPTKAQFISKSTTKGSFKSAIGQLIDYLFRGSSGVTNSFAAFENSPNDLTLWVDAGKLLFGPTLVSKALQAVTGFTAAASTKRIDRVVIDAVTGVASRVAGTEAASPVAPSIPTGKLPVCQVGPFLTTTTTIPQSMITDERALQTSLALFQSDLVDYLHIDADTAHRDLIRGGYLPAFFNQQWGGAPHYFELADAATGVTYKFESATGYVDDGSTAGSAAAAAGNTWNSQGFKVSKNTSLVAIWVKVYKSGNPANNLELRILPDDGVGKPSGATAISNGTATALSGKVFGSDTIGQWVRFVFPTPPSVNANTQYHITLKSSGAVDAVNFWNWKSKTTTGAYPHGQVCQGDATPTWTATATSDYLFLTEILATDESVQTGGLFNDGKLNFFEGSPINQSNGRVKDLKDFTGLDLTDFTLPIFGATWTKDKTILDIMYGMDHNRIVLRCNVTTGFAQIDLYDSASTKKTVTGTVDVSTGNSLLGIRIRAKADGADVVELWENGVKTAASLAAQTISFDKQFGQARLGTFWLGGGWQVTPTWTQKLAMGLLPSADSPAWTWTGVATEANAMSVSNGKLFQNKNGYTALQDGYYAKTVAGLSNANGWAIADLSRVVSDNNTKAGGGAEGPVVVRVRDGTKELYDIRHEYFVQEYDTTALTKALPQIDYKTATFGESLLIGKGSDYLRFFNGRLITDGTGQLTTASATNQIDFGDVSVTSGENADAVWDYVSYYSTAWLPPQFTSGSLSEFAIWNGDKTSLLLSLWNSGSPISIKQLIGMGVNHGREVSQISQVIGVTRLPTTTSTTLALSPEMENFSIGSDFEVEFHASGNTGATAASHDIRPIIDGSRLPTGVDTPAYNTGTTSAGETSSATVAAKKKINFGLHKFEGRWLTSSGTYTSQANARTLNVIARA